MVHILTLIRVLKHSRSSWCHRQVLKRLVASSTIVAKAKDEEATKLSSINPEKFIDHHIKLLKMESDAEERIKKLNEMLEIYKLVEKGNCINKLIVTKSEPGCFGRNLVTFMVNTDIVDQDEHNDSSNYLDDEGFISKNRVLDIRELLPSSRLKVGDVVDLGIGYHQKKDIIASGVILKMKSREIVVAFNEDKGRFPADKKNSQETDSDVPTLVEALDSFNLFLLKSTNTVTTRRYLETLEKLKEQIINDDSDITNELFGRKSFSHIPNIAEDELHNFYFYNCNLDLPQKQAIIFAMNPINKTSIIHGPPGTGKTITLVEIIKQHVLQGLKVLVTAPTNTAIDNLLEKLMAPQVDNPDDSWTKYPPKVVRLGHPGRTADSLLKYTMDYHMSKSPNTKKIERLKSKIKDIIARRSKSTSKYESDKFKNQLSDLFTQYNKLDSKVIYEILSEAKVVVSTLNSAAPAGILCHLMNESKDKKPFDLIVIDESSQAVEASSWIGISMTKDKLIMAGDHHQLSPIMMSNEAAAMGLKVSLMERLIRDVDEDNRSNLLRMLTNQYRSNQAIMSWSSATFYDNKLCAHESVKDQTLNDYAPKHFLNSNNFPPRVLIDTSGCNMREDINLNSSNVNESKANRHEVQVTADIVKELLGYKFITQDMIGVISPYSLQVELIWSTLRKVGLHFVQVSSIDSFQGQEKEIIILSLVRSNHQGLIGFLDDPRRINVAVTRAKRMLIVIGDSETVSSDKHIKSLISSIEQDSKSLIVRFRNSGRIGQMFVKDKNQDR